MNLRLCEIRIRGCKMIIKPFIILWEELDVTKLNLNVKIAKVEFVKNLLQFKICWICQEMNHLLGAWSLIDCLWLSDRNDRNIKRYNDRNDTFCLISENHSLFDSVMFNKLLEIKMICFSSNDLRHKNSNFL